MRGYYPSSPYLNTRVNNMLKSELPAILRECALDGSYNTLDINSLAEILAWIRNNSISYTDYHSVETRLGYIAPNPKPLPRKMTKIHKYLNQLPMDTSTSEWSHSHSFLGSEIHISFNRLNEIIFLVEIYYPEFAQ